MNSKVHRCIGSALFSTVPRSPHCCLPATNPLPVRIHTGPGLQARVHHVPSHHPSSLSGWSVILPIFTNEEAEVHLRSYSKEGAEVGFRSKLPGSNSGALFLDTLESQTDCPLQILGVRGASGSGWRTWESAACLGCNPLPPVPAITSPL